MYRSRKSDLLTKSFGYHGPLELHSLELDPLSTGESRFVRRSYSGLLLGSLARLDGQSGLGGACFFLGDLSDAVL